MATVEIITSVVGAIAIVAGAAGGIWSLADRYSKWRLGRVQPGEGKVAMFILSREDVDGTAFVEVLLSGDAMVGLRSIVKLRDVKVEKVEPMGEYIRCKFKGPPESLRIENLQLN